MPTYLPHEPDKHPRFLERRVYQGSSGKVYPLASYDRIATSTTDVSYDAVYLENEYLEVMLLPQIGGRIHAARDKTNGYDFIYRQDVIKPALVGLAGPWASGGIEFNWPQHHRPATWMPTEVHIENHADGAITVWMSDHDPLTRMKGMHGVCLYPDSSRLEVKARLHNRTETRQTFLWWANLAARVHELYQSFFPPDVTHVADHARRATSTFPLATSHYYGVDYGGRTADGIPAGQRPERFVPPADRYEPNDLSWYANIPVPTSYMVTASRHDFFGGYDHKQQAGFVHVADRHIAPGKKQWTWGNSPFGYAWDRNLSDSHEPYIELMAGIFTDNQPDFSWLMPGETRTFSQCWYPIRQIGPAVAANQRAALAVRHERGQLFLGAASSEPIDAKVVLKDGQTTRSWQHSLSPDSPWTQLLPRSKSRSPIVLELRDASTGEVIVGFDSVADTRPATAPQSATEPPPPEDVSSNDELLITATHLAQYRHATRSPLPYLTEALRRDPRDWRCHCALAEHHYHSGEFFTAEQHARAAVTRLTLRNSNPPDGQAHYLLGLSLLAMEKLEEAYEALSKAGWNQPWKASASRLLAAIDLRRGRDSSAIRHLEESLRADPENLLARSYCYIAHDRSGKGSEHRSILDYVQSVDPLDGLGRFLSGRALANPQVALDVSFELLLIGEYDRAVRLLENIATGGADIGAGPMILYTLAYAHHCAGRRDQALKTLKRASEVSPDWCFPSRLAEINVLKLAIELNPKDARAPYYLGNLYYDRRRYADAVSLWKQSAKLDPSFAIVLRNLGMAAWNNSKDPAVARRYYAKAMQHNPHDSRLLFEQDQLLKRTGLAPKDRHRLLARKLDVVVQRDDLLIEYCTLLNHLEKPAEALKHLASRRFQPWEGGEGLAIGQYTRANLRLAWKQLAAGRAAEALVQLERAIRVPENLGEERHPLSNLADLWYWMGRACQASGDGKGARKWFITAAEFKGDFQEMTVRAMSEMTLYSALSLRAIGREAAARRMLVELLEFGRQMEKSMAKIDYFATSLPTMLVFDEDLQKRQALSGRVLQAQAMIGLGRRAGARTILRRVMKADPSHPIACDLLESLSLLGG